MPRVSTLPASWSAVPVSDEARHYRRLFEQAPDGHLLTDAAGRIAEANAVAAALLAASPEGLRGQSLLAFVSPEHRKSLKARLSRSGAARHASAEWEFRMRNGEGHAFEAALAVTLLPEEKGVAASLLWSVRDISGRKRTEAKLKESEHRHRSLYRQLLVQRDQLRFLSARYLHAREDEARRLAHRLHDEAAQITAAAHLALDDIAPELPAALGERLLDVRAVLDGLDEHLRCLSHELRPTLLDDMGLAPALGFLAESFSARTGIPVEVEGDLGQERLDPLVETALYRIIQEALANVGRHAEAGRVAIRFERRQRCLRFLVRDDGVGFDPGAVGSGRHGGLGLLGMRERLAAIGGRLDVVSSPGRGAQLTATLPLRLTAPSESGGRREPRRGVRGDRNGHRGKAQASARSDPPEIGRVS
jgi:PAS domain S-box-containing protein